jgi:tetratricopeptide (TPR) repeat protein
VIGAALESRAGENNAEVIDLLAYHYALSDDQSKALYYLQRAGQKALLGNANEAAIGYFTQALKIADETDQVRVQFELLAGRERAYDRLGNRLAQTEDLRLMEQLAADSDQGLQAILQQLETHNRRMLLLSNLGQYAQAVEIAEAMLTLARSEAQTAWEARILSNVGIISWRQGEHLRAPRAMRQSLKLADQINDYQLKATCLNYLGLIHTRLADYAQARQDYQQALQLYCDIGDRAGEAACANNLGLLEANLGRYQAAQQHHAQSLSICRTIGDRHLEGISLNLLGSKHLALGNTRQAQLDPFVF